MKNLFLALALLFSGVSLKADDGYVIVHPPQMLIGDQINRPLAANPGDNTPYLASWLGMNTLALAAATGVTFAATISIPGDATNGDIATIGVTVSYAGITNSAELSATAKVEISTLLDANANTTAANTATVFAKKNVPTSASSRLLDLELGDVRVYPYSKVDLFVNRMTGSNQIIHVSRVWIKYKRKGWF